MTIERVDRVADVWRVVVMMAAVTVALLAAAVEYSNAGQFLPDASARALDGAIDIHVHSYPDDRAAIDRRDRGREAGAARGMRAIVLKNHYDSTAGLAYMVRKQVPGIEVFGGIDLNLHGRRHQSGGRRAHDADVRRLGTVRLDVHVRRREPGALLQGESAVRERLEGRRAAAGSEGRSLRVIAKHRSSCWPPDMSSAEEGLMLLREGQRQGVQHMVVTHAMNVPDIAMTVPQMQEAAKLGAFIEFAARIDRGRRRARPGWTRFADAIRKSAGILHPVGGSRLERRTRCRPTASRRSSWRSRLAASPSATSIS